MSEPSDDLVKQKEAAYFDALLRSFIDLRRERDKMLLALSTGGIGLLVTLLTAFGFESWCSGVLFFAAVGFFIAAIVLALWLFSKDAEYIQAILRNEANARIERHELRLRMLDRVAFGTFLVALVFAVAFGVAQGVTQLDKGSESTMTEHHSRPGGGGDLQKSLTGLADLRPASEPSAPSPAPTAPAAPAAEPPAAGTASEQ